MTAGDKVVIISGTSSGIGLETAVAAARAGWRTVATLRGSSREEALRTAVRRAQVEDLVEVRRMDVTDPSSVERCVAEVVADHGRLDAVVNNAGAGHVATLEQETVDDVRAVMEVNFFGVLHLTRAALPHLRESGGRVVSVTSVGGVVGQPFNEAYCAAKFAVEGFMEALAPVAATTGVRVVVVEPGAVASDFVDNAGLDRDGAVAAAGPYASALASYLERASSAFAAAQTPQDAAATVVGALTDPAPPLRLQTSDQARAFVGAKLADLDGSRVLGMTSGWLA
ncbi:SDR family NAD(P)-dependent oxidoreductase [Streptomyces sp. NPDC001380]|uniref:SDR family NAD(P)-dependent oxidoreductase n=1 Tax=Streptomyces sp. NPDC001380 TaxID=3364566 RepID=UPI00368F6C49